MHRVMGDERSDQTVNLQTILLATDGSAEAHCALKAAADLAGRSGAALHLVTAYHFRPSSMLAFAPYIGPDSAWDVDETHSRVLLDAERERVEALGATVSGMHVAREPAFEAVMQVGQTIDADLIVIGNRELASFSRLLVGSVSNQVLHKVHRPVLIVRGGEGCWPPAQVVVGIDNSAVSRRAARFAATIAHLYDAATISLLEVEAEVSIAQSIYLNVDEVEAEHRRVEHVAETLVPLAGRTVSTAVAVGDPATALVKRGDGSSESTLVVVGTRDLGAVQRLLLGSVSTRILHAGHTPLLVVPDHRDER
jgi:nucleotide-binding universal stress UspA family protein